MHFIVRAIGNMIDAIENTFIIFRSGLFDSQYYSVEYGIPKLLAMFDYAWRGFRLGRDPSRAFSGKKYYTLYPDVASAGANPLVHYWKYGKREKRIYFGINECNLFSYFFSQVYFDSEYYKTAYMSEDEIRDISPIEHYCKIGWKEKFKSCEVFDIDAFDEDYPNCIMNPLFFLLKERVTKLYVSSFGDRDKLGYMHESYINHLSSTAQYAAFDKEHPNAATSKRIILFLVPSDDFISGGLMSICGIYSILRRIAVSRGYDDIISISFPWNMRSIYRYSLFDNEMSIFNYDLLISRYRNVRDILIMIPELCVDSFRHFLDDSKADLFFLNKKVHLNIMNQNIELMPYEFVIKELIDRFDSVTQTVAHRKYCTQYYRDLYGIPTHLVFPPIEKKFQERSYEEKENVFAFSSDDCAKKVEVLKSVAAAFPDMRFVEIKNLSFHAYLDLISRVKWAMSFGEGLDGYFIEPYYCGGISFCVWNENFFTENFRGLPTIFEDYEDAARHLPSLMRELDNKENYEAMSKRVKTVHETDYQSCTSQKMLEDFLDGQYDFL